MPRCDRLNCASQRGNIGSPPAPGLQVYSRSAIDFVAASGSVFWPLFAFKWLVKLLLVLDRFNRFQPNAIHELKLNAHPPAGVNMPSDYRLNLLAFALRQRVESFTNVLRELHSSSSFSNYRPQRRLKTRQRSGTASAPSRRFSHPPFRLLSLSLPRRGRSSPMRLPWPGWWRLS